MAGSTAEKFNPLHIIATAIVTIVVTVFSLGHYGYLHFAKPEDALLLAEFTMLKTIVGEDYRASLKPAQQYAQCRDGFVVLFDERKEGLSGVLVDDKKRIVRCD